MAFVIVLLLAVAAALTPDAQAAHHHRAPPSPPPPPPPLPVWPPPDACVPYLDICLRYQCDCGPHGDLRTPLDGFSICADYCCRPVVPPVASPAGLSATSSAAAEFVTTGFPGLSASSSSSSAAAHQGSSSTAMSTTTSASAACVTPLAALSAACGAFLTKGDPATPAPQSKCCSALVAFVNGSSTAADDDGDRDTLRCVSPRVLRHVNRLLDAPLDLARIMYLPIQCGVVFPPETLYVCLTGQQRPPLVSRIPEGWEKPV